MAVLKPFRGLRPPRELASAVACPPYDVVSVDEARAHAAKNPRSFFHVSRPEVALPAGVDEHADQVYREGRKQLSRFVAEGWLKQDREPVFYVYRQATPDHSQVGLVALASVDEYDKGLIKRHELTRSDKEDDRTKHISAIQAHDEPVFLTYRARTQIDELIAEGVEGAPEYDFEGPGGVKHTFWVAGAELSARLEHAFADIPGLYIADGHHRSAAASRAKQALSGSSAAEEAGRFLAVVFPHNQLQILAYNRLVKDLNGMTAPALAARLKECFEVSLGHAREPEKVHQFGMYVDQQWYRLTARPGTFEETPVGVLDVAILQKNVLEPIFGIHDPRTDGRIAFVGGVRGTAELEARVNSGEQRVAFCLHPTRLEQLMAIADAGAIMPPKSTWFEPKPLSGLVLHAFQMEGAR